MRALAILSLFGLGFLLPIHLSAQTKNPSPENIGEWIDKLTSTRAQIRELAMKSLETAGEPALELLRKAANHEDADVQKRVAWLLAEIEKAIENRKHLDVPRFSLKYEDETLRSVVANINRKTKMQVHLDEKGVTNPARKVSFEVNDATAFEVVAKFMDVAGLKESDRQVLPNANEQLRSRGMIYGRGVPDQNPNFNRLVLVDGKTDLPSTNSGPLRIRVLAKDQSAKTQGSNEISLKLDVFHTQPTNWRGLLGVDIKRAIDENGQDLQQSYLRQMRDGAVGFSEDGAVFWGGGGMQFQAIALDMEGSMPMGNYNPRHLPITFFAGKKASRTLKELEGVIHGKMLTPPTTLAKIEDVSSATAKETYRSGNTTLQVIGSQHDAKKGSGFVRYRLMTMVSFNNDFGQFGGGPFGGGIMLMDEMGLNQTGQPQVSLRDANGVVIPKALPQMTNQNSDGITNTIEAQINYTGAANIKGPFKLYLIGQKEVEISVPFILKNVQLP